MDCTEPAKAVADAAVDFAIKIPKVIPMPFWLVGLLAIPFLLWAARLVGQALKSIPFHFTRKGSKQ